MNGKIRVGTNLQIVNHQIVLSLARIIHEGFYSNRAYAAATSLAA